MSFKVRAMEEETFQALRKMADRLCGGSDRMRDEGNLMVILLGRVEEVELPESALLQVSPT